MISKPKKPDLRSENVANACKFSLMSCVALVAIWSRRDPLWIYIPASIVATAFSGAAVDYVYDRWVKR